MTGLWLRRAFAAAACVSAALLAGCGSSSTVSALTPARIVVFGDATAALGTGGGSRYTVNDGSLNNWTLQVAAQFARPLGSTADGGQSHAVANARVTSAVDAAGGANPPVTQQITNFLAAGAVGTNDLIIVNAGTSDIIAQTAAVIAATQTGADAVTNAGVAGKELGAQVRRLVTAGAKYVVVVGPYDLSRTPWSTASGQAATIFQASSKFNEELLISIVDLGANVLYVDAAFYFNLVTSSPTTYSFDSAVNVACNSVNPGPGIGTGAGKVDSSLCTPSTITIADYNKAVFADGVYSTPQMQRLFGDYAYSRIRNRF
ncbi:MAG: SGNH/GDSL hydrolase family protein [Pseudomonadota bacterium]